MEKSKIKAPAVKGIAASTSGLKNLIEYIIKVNPKKLMRLIYESGNLPYNEKEPIESYLTRNTVALIHEEGDSGIEKLLSIHPDKGIILDLFALPTIVEPLNFADPIKPESPIEDLKKLIGSGDDLIWGISKCGWINISLILLAIYMFFILSIED